MKLVSNFYSERFLAFCKAPSFIYACFLIYGGFSVVARLLFNGESLGLDYGLFQPDGANYAFRSLIFLGVDQFSAADQVARWYEVHGLKHNLFSPASLLPINNPDWNLSAPRVIYPLLSAPFVFFLGIPGMLVIPVLCSISVPLLLIRIGIKIGRGELALILSCLFLGSVTVNRWMIANITDCLLVLFCTLFLLTIKSNMNFPLWSISTIMIILLGSFTRFSYPIWFCLGIFHLLNHEKRKGIIVQIAALLGAFPLIFFSPASGITGINSESSLFISAWKFLLNSLEVVFVEVAQIFVLDRLLFLLLLAGLLVLFVYPKNEDSLLFVCVIAACFFIGSLNGVIGVNFRYYLPCLPFLINLIMTTEWSNYRKSLNIVS